LIGIDQNDVMLIREKTILRLLTQINKPLSKTVFVKLVFLLRQETVLKDMSSFYDFLPYKFGPLSFTLYRELDRLKQYGYVKDQDEQVALCESNLTQLHKEIDVLPTSTIAAVKQITTQYGDRNQNNLISDVYRRYPWFAFKSQLIERNLIESQYLKKAPPAVYTAGYEGKSVDMFLNQILQQGITALIDVRANPISRKYGFAGVRLKQFCEKLDIEYLHLPKLGISSNYRTDLSNYASYQRLLHQYETQMLSQRSNEIAELGRLMCQKPSVLVCVEKDIRCCHRGRLANALASATGMKIIHL